jgi:hypothetical protein
VIANLENVAEIEQLVLDNRTADISAEVVVRKMSYRRIEEVAR